MKTGTKKFIKWLILGDIICLVLLVTLGLIFITPNCVLDCEKRFELLGRGAGQFLVFSNVGAGLIYYGISRRKRKA